MRYLLLAFYLLAVAACIAWPFVAQAQAPPPASGTQSTDDETVTGDWTFDAAGAREWTPTQTSDLVIGDGTEGQIKVGSCVMGRANDTNVGGTDLSGVFVFYNTLDVEPSDIAMLVADGSDNTPRFVIPEKGIDLATYSPRSMIVGPPATFGNVTTNMLCSTTYDDLACDADVTGADLGVENDIALGGVLRGAATDADGFTNNLAFDPVTADRTFTFGDDADGYVCTDTNGRCSPEKGVGHLYESDLDGTPGNSIAIATGGTYYGWTTASAGIAEGGLTLDVANVTADSITVDDAGSYMVAFSVGASGSANAGPHCCVHVEGSIPAGAPCAPRKIGTGGDVGNFGASAPLALAASDELDLRCTTEVGEDGKTLDLWQVHLWVTEINT